MFKSLLAGVLFTGSAIGFALGGGAAHAASYPPGSIGTISMTPNVCEYGDDDKLDAWSLTINYEVTAPDIYLLVIAQSDHIVIEEPVPMGAGSLTIDESTPGLGPRNGYFTIDAVLVNADGDAVFAEGYTPCKDIDPTPVGTLTPLQDDCTWNADFTSLTDWTIKLGYRIDDPIGGLVATVDGVQIEGPHQLEGTWTIKPGDYDLPLDPKPTIEFAIYANREPVTLTMGLCLPPAGGPPGDNTPSQATPTKSNTTTGSELPHTGGETAWFAFAAMVMLTLGGALVGTNRRRGLAE